MELFGEQNNSTKTVLTASRVQAVTFVSRRERELVSHSLWASFRSLATMNINVVKLSLNGNRPPWVATCVAYQLSLVPCKLGSRAVSFLFRLSLFQ